MDPKLRLSHVVIGWPVLSLRFKLVKRFTSVFYLFICLFYIGVRLIYNVVLVSGVQQSDTYIILKTETDSQTSKTNLGLPNGKEGERDKSGDRH